MVQLWLKIWPFFSVDAHLNLITSVFFSLPFWLFYSFLYYLNLPLNHQNLNHYLIHHQTIHHPLHHLIIHHRLMRINFFVSFLKIWDTSLIFFVWYEWMKRLNQSQADSIYPAHYIFPVLSFFFLLIFMQLILPLFPIII